MKIGCGSGESRANGGGEEVGVLGQWLQSLEVTPTIVALRSRTQHIKRREVDKVLARMPHLSSDDRAAVEALASAIVNKMVHGTMVTLKMKPRLPAARPMSMPLAGSSVWKRLSPYIPPSRQRRRNSLREMVPFTRPVDFPNRHWFSIQRRSWPARSLTDHRSHIV